MRRNADWLTARRARFSLVCLAVLSAAFLLWVGLATIRHAADRPVALDFAAFWAAARLAASGQAASAYDNGAIEALERAFLAMPPGYLAFYYPPTFLLLLLPLGLLGYGAALAIFVAGGTALALATLRRLMPAGWSWLPLLTFPGFLMNGLSGQNAALSSACFAGAALWLERRPMLAGACLGALACKPQLAACAPVALVAGGRWRVLGAYAAASWMLAILSWLVLGSLPWHGFMANAPMARLDIETIPVKWPCMQSVFGAIRLAGGGNTPAYAAQALVSLAALAALAFIARRRPGARLEASAIVAATLLFTPFLYDYDLAILGVPLACLAALAEAGAWRRWEKPLLAGLFIFPLVARAAGLLLHVAPGPLLVAALLALIYRRSTSEAQRSHGADGLRA